MYHKIYVYGYNVPINFIFLNPISAIPCLNTHNRNIRSTACCFICRSVISIGLVYIHAHKWAKPEEKENNEREMHASNTEWQLCLCYKKNRKKRMPNKNGKKGVINRVRHTGQTTKKRKRERDRERRVHIERQSLFMKRGIEQRIISSSSTSSLWAAITKTPVMFLLCYRLCNPFRSDISRSSRCSMRSVCTLYVCVCLVPCPATAIAII